MNKIYRVVWNAALNCWVVVSELGKGKKKSKTAKSVAVAGALSLLAPQAWGVSDNCNSVTQICDLGTTWNPQDNNDQKGAAIIDDGKTYSLKGPLGFKASANYYTIVYSAKELIDKGGYVINPPEIPENSTELKMGQKFNIIVPDPSTGTVQTVSVYDSNGFTETDSDNIVAGVVKKEIDDIYLDTRLATITYGTADVNLENEYIFLGIVKDSSFVYVDGSGNTEAYVNWKSSNSIGVNSSNTFDRDQTGQANISVTEYTGIQYNYTNDQGVTVTKSVNSLPEFKEYNNYLISELQDGNLTQAQYETELRKAYNTKTDTLIYYRIPRGEDGEPVNNWEYVAASSDNAVIRADGKNASVRIDKDAIVSSAIPFIQLHNEAEGYNYGDITTASGTSVAVYSGSKFENHGRMKNGRDTSNIITVSGNDSIFTNHGVINGGAYANSNSYTGNNNVLAQSVLVSNNGLFINRGDVNVDSNTTDKPLLKGSVWGLSLTNSKAENYANINISQDESGEGIKNNTGGNNGFYTTVGVRVNGSLSRFSNFGTINLSTHTNGAQGVSVVGRANATNEKGGAINLYGNGNNGEFIAGTNIGMFAQDNGSTAINEGTINVMGSNNIALRAASGGTVKNSGGTINVQGGLNAQGVPNYGAEAESGGTIIFEGGELNLKGDNAIGVVVRSGGKAEIQDSPVFNFSDGVKQIGYLINGAGAMLINSGSGKQTVHSDDSILIRVDNGASLTGGGEAVYEAAGNNANVIVVSGKGSSVDAEGMNFIASGADSVALRVEGGAAGKLGAETDIKLTGEGAVAGVADGEEFSILGTSLGIKEGTLLESSATLVTQTDEAIGYIAKNTATVVNSGNMTFGGKDSVAVNVLSGSSGENTGNIVLEGAGSTGLLAKTESGDQKTTLTHSGTLTLNGEGTTGALASGADSFVTVGADDGTETRIEVNGRDAVGIKTENGGTATVTGNTTLVFNGDTDGRTGFWVDGAGSEMNVATAGPVIADGTGMTVFKVTGGATLGGALNIELNQNTPSGSAGTATGMIVDGQDSVATLSGASDIKLGNHAQGILVTDSGRVDIQDGAQFTLNGTDVVAANIAGGILSNAGSVTSTDSADSVRGFEVTGGELANSGTIDLSKGQNNTGILISGGTVNNSGDITANGIALDIAGDAAAITNTGNIEATDGTAAIRVGDGASLDLSALTTGGSLKAGGTADGILLTEGATGLNVAGTTIDMADNASGTAINNQAGIDVSLSGTTINAGGTGNGILMTGGDIYNGGNASVINVSDGTGVIYESATDDISLSGDLTVGVSGTGTGISAELNGNDLTAELDINISVNSADGGHAADISGAQTVNNSGSLTSQSGTNAVLNVNDALNVVNSGTIQAASADRDAVLMNGGDKTFTNSQSGNITGNLNFGGGSNTLIAETGSAQSGTVIMTGGGNQTVKVESGAVIGDVILGTGTNTVQLSGTLGNFTGQDGGKNTVTVSGDDAAFTRLDAGKGTDNTLIFDDHTYTLASGNQDAIQHFDTVTLTNGAVLTLEESLLMTAGLTASGGTIDIGSGAELKIDGPEDIAHRLSGNGNINVTGKNSQFNFADTTGDQFAGNVDMGAVSFSLSGNNTKALTNATLTLKNGNTTQVGQGEQSVGGLTFDEGILAFDIDQLGSRDNFVTGIVTTGHLDMSGDGTVQLNYSGSDLGFDLEAPTTVPLLDQQNQVLTQLIKAGSVEGEGGTLSFIDKDGNKLSARQQENIIQGTDGIVAVADYDYRATNGPDDDGLWLGFGLTQLDIQEGKVLNITTSDSQEKDLSARVTGSGDLGIMAGNDGGALTISNQDNDYTGRTLIKEGTLILGNNDVLGETKELSLAADTTVRFSDGYDDYTQTVGALNTASDSHLDLAGGGLTVTQGGEVSGTLSGTGTLTITGNPDNTALTVNSANTGFGGTVTVDTAGELILTDISGIGSSLLTLSDGQATLAGTSGTFTNTMTGAGTLTASQGSAVTLGNDNSSFKGTLATETGSSLTVTTQENVGGTTAVNNDGQFIVSNAGVDITLAAAVSGSGDLIKTEENTLVLSGDNTYTGTLKVQGGTVAVSNDRNLGDATSRTILDGGDLRITDDITGERTVTLAQNGGAVVVDGGKTASLSGWDYQAGALNQQGTVAFTKKGDGTLKLTGDNSTNLGDVTVSGGVLSVSNTGNLGSDTGIVTLDKEGVLLVAQQPSEDDDVLFGREIKGDGTLRADLASGSTDFGFADTAGNGGLFTGQLDLVNGQFTFSDTNDAVLTNATLKLSGSGDKTGTAYLEGEHTIGGLAMNGGSLVVDYSENSFTADGHLTVTELLDVSGGGNVVISTPENLPVPTGEIDSSASFFDQTPAITDYIVTNASGQDTVGAGSQLGLVDSEGSAVSQGTSVELTDAGSRVGDAVYDYGAFVDNQGIGVGYGLTELSADKDKQILITDKGTESGNTTLGVKLSGEGGFSFAAQDSVNIGNAASNYTGVTDITGGSVIAITDNAFGLTSELNVNTGTAVDFNGNSQTVGTLNISSGAQVMLSENTVNGKVTELTVTDGGKVSGINALTGKGQLAVNGGNLVITDNNSDFRGQTVIGENGTVTLTDGAQGLGYGSIDVAGGLVLDGTRGSLLNSLSGDGSVSLTGGGDIWLNADNKNFSGTFTVSQGTMTAADSKNTGTADIVIDREGTFIVNNDNNNYWVLANDVSGDGTLVKKGQGVLAVNDSNVTVGQLDISNGIVFAGDTASAGEKANLTAGTVNVMQGGALGGYGTVTGNVDNRGDIFAGSAFGGWTSPVAGEAGKFTIDGNYSSAGGNIFFSGALNGDNDSRVDRLSITGDASGNSNVYVNNIGGRGAQTEQGIQLIDIGGNYQGATFTLKGRAVAGAYEYFLYQGDVAGDNMNNWYLRSEQYVPGGSIYRPETGSYISNLATANSLFDNRLYDRNGGGFVTDPVTGERYESSLWLRNVNGRNHWKTGNGQITSDTNRYLIQMGGNVAQTTIAGGPAYAGIMAGYGRAYGTSSSNVTKYQSKSELSGYSAGVYGTWFENPEKQTGGYVDSWVQYNWFNNTVKGDELGDETYKSSGITASLETGYSMEFAETTGSKGSRNRWFVQPQAQVTYHGVKQDDHRERNGTRVTGSGGHNVQTRLGVKVFGLGHAEEDNGLSREFKPFAEINWLHNTGSYGVSMDGQDVTQSGSRNIGEVKVGVEGQLNRNLELWGNVGVQMGGNGYNDTQAVLGVKYRF